MPNRSASDNAPAQTSTTALFQSEDTLFKHRQHIRKQKLPVPKNAMPKVAWTEQRILLDKDYVTSFRIYRSTDLNPDKEKYPTIFFIPGSAYIADAPGPNHTICEQLAKSSKYQVILVPHRLAPENPAPIPISDSFAAYRFFISSSDNIYRVDYSRIVIAGYSSGANIAILIALRAIKEQLPIGELILFSPLVDLSRSLAAENERTAVFEAQDRSMKPEFVKWFLDLYIPEHMKRTDPSISPFFEKDEWLSQLPLVYIFCGEYDRFRRDSEEFADKLRKLKVRVHIKVLKGVNHSFLWSLYGIAIVEHIGNRLASALYKKTKHVQRLSLMPPPSPNFVTSSQDKKALESEKDSVQFSTLSKL